MIEHVIFTSDADDDVAASYNWYEKREPGLGEEFLRSIEACVRGIQRHPEMYPVAIDEFSACVYSPLPFEIFYELTGTSIIIYLFCVSLLTRSAKVARASRLVIESVV